MRIRIKGYDHKIVEASVKQVYDALVRYGAQIVGPIPLPTEIKKYTVNRSTFVHKDAREQFETRIHKRVIDILSPSKKIIEGLQDLNLPSGVEAEIKMI